MDRAEEAGLVVVTFRLPDRFGAQYASVVGEFNDWSLTSHPMKPDGDGFVARIALAPGRAYRFRYLLDGVRWENDWEADAYAPNEYGGDDSVVDLTDAAKSLPPEATAETPPEPPAEAPPKAKAKAKANATAKPRAKRVPKPVKAAEPD